MKAVIALFLLASLTAVGAEKDELLQRLKIAETIFDERFGVERMERILGQPIEAELNLLEKVEAATEYVTKIRKLLGDVARDVVSSREFKDQYTTWLASQLSRNELESYLDFLRSDLGRKIGDLDDRVLPLVSNAVSLRSKGRLDAIQVFLAEARSK